MQFEKTNYLKEQFSRLIGIDETVKDITFENCEFTDCTLVSTKFLRCRFLNCSFTKCDLSNMLPTMSDFRDVKFSNCKAIGIDWTRAAKGLDLSFSECILNYSNFRFLRIPKVVMKKCEIKDVDFIETTLTGANFTWSDFENSTFFKANLSSADFTNAKNYAIDVKTNKLKKAKFSLPDVLSLLGDLDIIIE